MASRNLSIRLTEAERRALDFDARQKRVGASTRARQLVRTGLGMGVEAELSPAPSDDFEDHERRLSRLEEMAGL